MDAMDVLTSERKANEQFGWDSMYTFRQSISEYSLLSCESVNGVVESHNASLTAILTLYDCWIFIVHWEMR